MRKRYELDEEETLINLTPLIDVVFVVLITFILIAPLLEIDKVILPKGHAKTVPLTKKGVIVIKVDTKNTISINGTLCKKKDLENRLKTLKKEHPLAIPQLFHDKKAFFGTYQFIKNGLEEAGFNAVDVVVKN